MKLEQSLNLKTKRLPNGRCVKVNWKKIKSAGCKVKYVVILRDAYTTKVNEKYGYNIDSMNICNILTGVRVTKVQLTVLFRTVSKNVTANLEGDRMPVSQKEFYTTQGNNLNELFPTAYAVYVLLFREIGMTKR